MNHPFAAQAIAVDPQFADAYSNMGNAYKDLGRLDDAIRCYGEALKLRPDFADACSNLAAAYKAGQQKRAKFPTSKAPISAVFHSFRLIFGRAIISRNGLEAWMLFLERARAEHSR